MKEYFDNPAPAAAHQRLDRLWLCKEPDGEVSCSAVVKDPDSPETEYYMQVTLTRVRR